MSDLDNIEALLRERIATLKRLEQISGSGAAAKKFRVRQSEVSKLLGEVRQMKRMKAYERYARQHPRRNGFSPTPDSEWKEFLSWYTGPKDLFEED